jgi:hypothetical protein
MAGGSHAMVGVCALAWYDCFRWLQQTLQDPLLSHPSAIAMVALYSTYTAKGLCI